MTCVTRALEIESDVQGVERASYRLQSGPSSARQCMQEKEGDELQKASHPIERKEFRWLE